MKRAGHVRLWASWACVVWLSAGAPARAAEPAPTGSATDTASLQQRAAAAHSKAGRKEYKQGHYAEAAAEFERALDLYPNPTLLFNLAQAHRHNGSTERAIFYFKRYLVMVPHAPDRADVEIRIHELEQGATANVDATRSGPAGPAGAPSLSPGDAAGAPPVPAPAGAAGGPAAIAAARPGGEATAPATSLGAAPAEPAAPPIGVSAAPATPVLPTAAADQLQQFEPESLIEDEADNGEPSVAGRRMRLLAHAGVGFPSFGGSGLERNSDLYAFAGAISASYAVPLSWSTLDIEVTASYAPVAYRNNFTGVANLSQQTGGFAGAGWRLALGPAITIGPSVALGLIWWTGLGEGNPFTESRQGTGSAVAMPSLRLSAPLLVRTGTRLLFGIEPAWSFYKTTNLDLSARTPYVRWLAVCGLVGFAL